MFKKLNNQLEKVGMILNHIFDDICGVEHKEQVGQKENFYQYVSFSIIFLYSSICIASTIVLFCIPIFRLKTNSSIQNFYFDNMY